MLNSNHRDTRFRPGIDEDVRSPNPCRSVAGTLRRFDDKKDQPLEGSGASFRVNQLHAA